MPARHSKNNSDKHHFTYYEKQKSGLGALKQRLGTESQLPFGYCGLSLQPAENPVVTPSGHIYSRESILEYLLTKSKDLKIAREKYEEQKAKLEAEEKSKEIEKHNELVKSFLESNEGKVTGKRKADEEVETEYLSQRKKVIDDTEHEVRLEQLRKVSPWIPQFTPEAKESILPEPPKRPLSPFSGQPLRSKDLISIELIRETSTSSDTSEKYICPVSRKTITNQNVYLIKPTGALMIKQAFDELALPSMTCPLTGKTFKKDDVLELVRASSAFAASGNVIAKKDRPNLN